MRSLSATAPAFFAIGRVAEVFCDESSIIVDVAAKLAAHLWVSDVAPVKTQEHGNRDTCRDHENQEFTEDTQAHGSNERRRHSPFP
jgi:hypothetical protein